MFNQVHLQYLCELTQLFFRSLSFFLFYNTSLQTPCLNKSHLTGSLSISERSFSLRMIFKLELFSSAEHFWLFFLSIIIFTFFMRIFLTSSGKYPKQTFENVNISVISESDIKEYLGLNCFYDVLESSLFEVIDS